MPDHRAVQGSGRGRRRSITKPPVLKALPDENTDAGAVARLFIAEVEYTGGDDIREARREMDLMHCVLVNRLKHPKDFRADQHAINITQIISASRGHVQFQGLESYPIIFDEQKRNIADKQGGASGDLGYDRSGYINTAIAAATDIPPSIPHTRLYF